MTAKNNIGKIMILGILFGAALLIFGIIGESGVSAPKSNNIEEELAIDIRTYL